MHTNTAQVENSGGWHQAVDSAQASEDAAESFVGCQAGQPTALEAVLGGQTPRVHEVAVELAVELVQFSEESYFETRVLVKAREVVPCRVILLVAFQQVRLVS